MKCCSQIFQNDNIMLILFKFDNKVVISKFVTYRRNISLLSSIVVGTQSLPLHTLLFTLEFFSTADRCIMNYTDGKK